MKTKQEIIKNYAHDFRNGIYPESMMKGMLNDFLIDIEALQQDKPVCEHKLLEPVHYKGKLDVAYYVCTKCGKDTRPSNSLIEDTNKTSLEVPEPIQMTNWSAIDIVSEHGIIYVVDKVNSILDYLTLISLDKK